jgi:predicted ATP-grasp superfamily ATP-dependent carboligase
VRIIGEDKEGEISLQKLCGLYESEELKIYTNLAMEYLPGPAYDVDVLAKNAHPLCVVPRRRTWKNRLSPFSEGCIVEDNKELVQFVENIIRVLKLNYVYDFDCGTTDGGKPAIYEINPRLSGAIAASAGAGVNLPVMLVKMLMGMEVPKCAIRFGTHMHPKPNGEMEFTYEERTLCR